MIDAARRRLAQERGERRDLARRDELLGRLRVQQDTSLITCLSVKPRALAVSGICFSTSGVHT